ncbi:MAG: hypothetical protein HY046_13585 [Acidobacteria bacterium]|nr:hypothetical protein [Acidobacteriota bacterium]
MIRTLTRSVFILLCTMILSSGLAAQQAKRNASPCESNPKYREFDFWVGEWDVEVVGAAAGTIKPRSSIQRLVNGCVILENWMPPNGNEGKSFNIFDPVTGKWEQLWMGSNGMPIHFYGGVSNGSMHYTAEFIDQKGVKQHGKMTYTPLGPDRVRQLWESSTDGGKTWTVAFDGTYVRRK